MRTWKSYAVRSPLLLLQTQARHLFRLLHLQNYSTARAPTKPQQTQASATCSTSCKPQRTSSTAATLLATTAASASLRSTTRRTTSSRRHAGTPSTRSYVHQLYWYTTTKTDVARRVTGMHRALGTRPGPPRAEKLLPPPPLPAAISLRIF